MVRVPQNKATETGRRGSGSSVPELDIRNYFPTHQERKDSYSLTRLYSNFKAAVMCYFQLSIGNI